MHDCNACLRLKTVSSLTWYKRLFSGMRSVQQQQQQQQDQRKQEEGAADLLSTALFNHLPAGATVDEVLVVVCHEPALAALVDRLRPGGIDGYKPRAFNGSSV